METHDQIQWDTIFKILDHSKVWNDFCSEYAPLGMFSELHDDVIQSVIAEIIYQTIQHLHDEAKERKQTLIQEEFKNGSRLMYGVEAITWQDLQAIFTRWGIKS